MDNPTSMFERAAARYQPSDLSVDAVLRRHDRRRRNQRLRAGALALAVAVVVGWWSVHEIRAASDKVPVTPPNERPADLGIFEPLAGRMVDWRHGKFVAVDPNATPPASTEVRLDLGGSADAEGFTEPLGWSSDGTELLLMREDPSGRFLDRQPPFDRYLYILHADGTETKVTPNPVADGAISPDGSRIAFARGGVSLPSGPVYVVDTDGGTPVRIADEGASPTFSPDGTRIAYLSKGKPVDATGSETGREHVWVVNVDGTDAHEILGDEPTLSLGTFSLTWSPAGDRIAMGDSLYGHFAIYTFAPDGSEFTELISGGFGPQWSPDGSQIAYDGLGGAAVADADGSNVRTLGTGRAGPWHPGTTARSSGSTLPPTPFTKRFASPLNALSVGYPSGWQTRAATEPWGGRIAFDAPDVDVIFDPKRRDDLYLAVVSEPRGSETPRDWVSNHTDSASLGVCYTGGGGGIGEGFQGNAAWFQECQEPHGAGGHIAIFATPTRGYVIYLHVADDPSLQATYDGDWFWGPGEAGGVLKTVELPADTLGTVRPTGSP
jgi:hypothetical protein